MNEHKKSATLPVSSFNTRKVRELIVWGDDQQVADIKKSMDPLGFIQTRSYQSGPAPEADLYFLLCCADLTELPLLQLMIRELEKHTSVSVQKLIYFSKLEKLTGKELLFTSEMGAVFTACKPQKDTDLRSFVKRVALESEILGSVYILQQEVNQQMRRGDEKSLKASDEKLAALDQSAEAVLTLRAMVAQYFGKLKIYEGFLKKILQLNSQNLWAANQLGRYYLRHKRAAEGIEVLSKLSAFHDLNGERLLELGDAYLNCGQAEKAEKVLKVGSDLNHGQDARFESSLAKADILQGREVEPSKNPKLNDEMISFLNTRAIMAIKNQQVELGYKLYNQAIDRAQRQSTTLAKLHYNVGLSLIRQNKVEEAIKHFETSVKMGASQFSRAEGPLMVAKKIMAQPNRKVENIQVIEFAYEDFYNKKT